MAALDPAANNIIWYPPQIVLNGTTLSVDGGGGGSEQHVNYGNPL